MRAAGVGVSLAMSMLGRLSGIFGGKRGGNNGTATDAESTPEFMKIRVGKCTVVGNYRDNNEDRCFVDPSRHIYIVADGMGGQAAGEVASQLAVDYIPRRLSQLTEVNEDSTLKKALVEIFAAANEEILKRGAADPTAQNMGTTVVLLLLNRPARVAYIAHIGDSRAYRLRAKKIEPLTIDHNLAQALHTAGTINDEELKNHRYRNVLYKYLGMKEAGNEPDFKPIDLKSGDRFLLASDGLTGSMTDAELIKEVSRQSDPQACANQLVQIALDNGSKDNVTCVMVYVDEI